MNFERVYDLFNRAAEMPPEERESFIEQECRDDPTTAKEVRDLLDAEQEIPSTFLGSTKIYGELERVTEARNLPSDIGPYQVRRVIGRGGMGVVYEAEQADPRRLVAVKVIRAGFVTPELLERFRREARVLGQMQHPGIAHVYEAGQTTIGDEVWPYFAMELIDGPSLDDYVAAECREPRERLELFARICDAVDHAHQRGVVHRDLKPSNILVTRDAARQPKILDFGVARVTDAKHAATLRTEVGQIIGTVGYMSPEQISGATVDLRSDVYALGVLLFRMLSGRLPFDLEGKSLPEIARILDREEPATLSEWDRTFRGDVDVIVAKALERDPERRYPSAAALADDVRRHLASQPVSARSPTAWYRLAKFTRRNKALVGGVAATIVALSVGLAVATAALFRANEERKTAVAATEFLTQMLQNADPGRTGEEVTLRQMLDDAAPRVRERLEEQPDVEAALQLTIARTYARLSAYDSAEAHAARAYAIYSERFGPKDDRAIDARSELGAIEAARGHNEEAQRLLEEVVAHQRSTLGPNDLRRIDPLLALASVASADSRFDDARALFEELERIEQQASPPLLQSLELYGYYSALELRTGHLERALELVDRVLPRAIEEYGIKRPEVSNTVAMKGIILRALERYDESLQVAQSAYDASLEVYGPDHHLTQENAMFLVKVLSMVERHEEAEALMRKVLASNTNADNRPVKLLSLAEVQMRAGELELAEDGLRALLAEDAFETFRSSPNGSYHVHMTLVDVLLRRSKFEEAERVASEELARVKASVGEDNMRYGRLGLFWVDALEGQGRFDEAEAALVRLEATQTGRVGEQITGRLKRARARTAGASQ